MVGPALLAGLAVGLSSVADPDDEDDQLAFDDLIDDAIVADPQPSQTSKLPLENTACRRLVLQPIDSFDDTDSILLLDPPQGLGGARLNLERVSHA